MDAFVVRCPFCGKRHAVNIEDLDIWFTQCPCGACGFIQDEAEINQNNFTRGAGFVVHEVPNAHGTFVHMADPIPIFVNEACCWVYVLWYTKNEKYA
jgi:hypothetical protein